MREIELYVLDTAALHLDKSTILQAREIGTDYTAACCCFLIDHPEGNVLFDTGIHPTLAADPQSYESGYAPSVAKAIDMGPDQDVLSHLDRLGYAPADVDYLVLSHLHFDHAGLVSAFEDSTVVVVREELRYAFWPEPMQLPYYLLEEFQCLRTFAFDVTVITEPLDIFGDGTIRAIPTPGHTPGHQVLRVELADHGPLYLAGDLAHIREAYDQDLCTAIDWSAEEAVASIRSIRQRTAAEDADIIFIHDAADVEAVPTPPEPLT